MDIHAPLKFKAGINPEPDETKQNTRYIIDGDNIRFYRGGVQKIGGHTKEALSQTPAGYTRSLLSLEIGANKWQIIGTNTKLYAKNGSTVTNITPLADQKSELLGTDPIHVHSGSATMDISWTAHGLIVGDEITLSGSTTVDAVDATTYINIAHRVASILSADEITVTLGTTAGSTTSGGGSAVIAKAIGRTAVLGTAPFSVTNGFPTVTVTYTAHGLAVGDRIKLAFGTATGGITAAMLNKEHIIATVPTADTFTITASGNASSTTTGGGSAISIFTEIAAGGANAVATSGAWVVDPALGAWSTTPAWASGVDASQTIQPRIWWMDVYGETLVCGTGQGGKCYQWLGDTATSPRIIANSPNADWGWIEDAKLVTLKGNRVKNSKSGDLTSWTPASDSAAYEDDKEDAFELITQSQANGENLIYAKENKIFRMRYVGGTVKWVWELASDTIGIASPFGRIVVGGIHYIFGRDNFYYYNGGIFAPIPNNTLLRYVFDDINLTQRYKFFVWYNQQYNELHFHYCSSTSEEPDRRVIYSIAEGHWSKGTITRSAADQSGKIFDYNILAHPTDGIYQHEIGMNDDTSAMNSYVQVAYESIQNGKYETYISGMEPDLILEGNMTIALLGKDRARDNDLTLNTFTLTEASNIIECEHEARWRSWKFTSNTVGGNFRLGGMREIVQRGGEF